MSLILSSRIGFLISNRMATRQQGAPSRPWLRLANMVQPPPTPTQQPDQAPPPLRPGFIRPAFTPNAIAPTSPPRATPSSIVPKEPRPSASPTIPRVTSTSPPPSLLLLPSPQLSTYQPEYEQKTVLTQEKKEKPNGRQVKGEILKKSSDYENTRVRIITIAGENQGAIMDLTPFSKKTRGNIKKDNPALSNDGDSKSGNDSEGKKKNLKSKTLRAIMNSNVQGVNNSILYNCSTSHHDPGVHLSLLRKPSGFNSGTK
ncbi:hypothetical protein R6Q57_027481 [Mikania cordata]